ncbi:uncharacterized protein METZ01_LOCUS322618 [marine metagenome]|uniref:Uncharacterized protein n=1 Tax=marine metagenome TaxID=408172 RepID=A0A382P8N7_9ZZZZ
MSVSRYLDFMRFSLPETKLFSIGKKKSFA